MTDGTKARITASQKSTFFAQERHSVSR